METSRIGFVGLGRMGLPMAKLLATHGVVVGFDSNTTTIQTAISTARSEDLILVNSLIELIADLPAPRVIWLMVPARNVSLCLDNLSPLLAVGDIVIDGGNSAVSDTLRHHNKLSEDGIGFVSVGCSGGLVGARDGPPMSVSCEAQIFPKIVPWLEALGGNYTYYSETGFGHLAKGLHNAIEYGMIQSLAEGLSLYFAHGFSQQQILQTLKTWSKGSIIQSNLLDCLIDCLESNDFEQPQAISRSETVSLLRELTNVHHLTPCIDTAIRAREEPAIIDSIAQTALALMRKNFGGHQTNIDFGLKARIDESD